MKNAPKRRAQHGATLIEAMIALVILAIGLLGVAGAQAATIHANHLAYQYTQATLVKAVQ